MIYKELRRQLDEASLGDHYEDAPVFVLDADGFIHEIQHTTWDPEDKCFYVSTKFAREVPVVQH
jgi:hypothetical protein